MAVETMVSSPLSGIVVELLVRPGDSIGLNDPVLILEAMKLETVVHAPTAGQISRIMTKEGALVEESESLLAITPVEDHGEEVKTTDPKVVEERTDLNELVKRKSYLKDEGRQQAVKKRHSKGKRTARENINDLCDNGSFVEYGSLILPAQRGRRDLQDLIENTPADGLICGIGQVNGDSFGPDNSECFVLSYDYTVLAGTQGFMGHKKTDRILRLAESAELPLIFFMEGGGGRPGDTDFQGVGGLDVMTFYLFARLNGQIPRIAIIGGYCFAGNASLAGCSDVIIATKKSSLGMGGPAMIEGGGLGQYHPSEVGPAQEMFENGVIDILVDDEEEAVKMAKKYLSYFQGDRGSFKEKDQSILRESIPQNRRRNYEVRGIIETLADEESVLELRKLFGRAMITSLILVEGQPMGLIANDPQHGGGAIDSDAADKAARFLQLCDAFDLPVLSLCDTPGIMVGPEAERSGTVRHANRLFLVGARLETPIFTVVTRRAYGLGSMAMAGGSFHVPRFTVSWPSGEFGGMGLEGAVKLGFRKELDAEQDPEKREALYNQLLEQAYETGKAINTASYLEIDEVIDPAETRKWIAKGLRAFGGSKGTSDRKAKFIDAW